MDSQITNRYTQAVQLLGAAGPVGQDLRLGGIYALDRIARDSPRDTQTIATLLATFIRSHAPNTPGQPCSVTPATDIQAALTILTTQSTPKNVFSGLRHDLHDACLAGADLIAADFTNANFANAILSNANLSGTDFTGADFTGAHLTDADLSYSELIDTHFDSANLTGANFTNAVLINTNLTGADLSRADFSRVDLSGTRHDASTIVNNVIVDEITQGKWW